MGQLVPIKERQVRVRDLIAKQATNLQAAMPRGMNAERFARVVTTVVLNNEALLDCTPQSLIACILQSAAWGLELDPVLGMAYLVPYKGQAKLIPGYRGLVELARRSGDVLGVTPRAVYENERFGVVYGLHEDIIHEPNLSDRGKLLAVYAIAHMRVGPPKFDVMHVTDVNEIRKRSASGSGPWTTDYEAMALKTVVRRLCNRQLPRTPELARAIAIDEQADRDETQVFDIDVPDVEPPREPRAALDALTEAIDQKPKSRLTTKPPASPDVPAEAIFAREPGQEG